MEIDFIVGILVFLVFVGWAFSYYIMIFGDAENRFEIAAETEAGKITDFLSVDVYEIPVRYDSPSPASGGVMRAESVWYHGEKNTTRVFSGSTRLPCRISGNTLYWQADLSAGENYFRILVANMNETMNCTGSFPVSSSNLTIPWALERREMLSLSRVSEMTDMDYEAFRSAAGLNEDFRVEIETAEGETVYGKSIPSGGVDVVVKKFRMPVFETFGSANITIAVW